MAVDKAATSLATSRMGFWRAANESPANGITAGARGVSHGPLRGPTDPWWSASELNSAKASRVGSGRQYSATDASDAITQPWKIGGKSATSIEITLLSVRKSSSAQKDDWFGGQQRRAKDRSPNAHRAARTRGSVGELERIEL